MVNYPIEWKERKLKDVADYRNGKAHEKNVVEHGKYIIVNAKFISTEGEVKKYCDEQIEPLFKDEIAIVLSDIPNGKALGKTYLINKNDKYSLNQRIAGITPHNDINSYFLAKLMNRNDYFLSFNDGINQTNLSVKNVMNFSVRYPTLNEQKVIADTLSSFDKHIDNLIRLLEKKRVIRDGVMEELISGRTRIKGFKEKWKEFKIKDIVQYRRGSFPQPYDNSLWYGGRNSMPFVQVADIADDMKLCEKTNARISKLAMPKSVFVKKGTLICSIQGTIGRVAITQYDSYIDRTIAIFNKFKINVDQKYFMYQLKRKFNIEKELAKGSTIKTITIAEYGEFSIEMPSLREQQAIAEILTEIDNEIILLEKELDKMKQIREGAMDDLLTGRVRLTV